MKVAGNNLFQLTGVLLAGNDSNQFLIFVSFFWKRIRYLESFVEGGNGLIETRHDICELFC